MFAVEIVAGITGGSKALQADALDFFGDAATTRMPAPARPGRSSPRSCGSSAGTDLQARVLAAARLVVLERGGRIIPREKPPQLWPPGSRAITGLSPLRLIRA